MCAHARGAERLKECPLELLSTLFTKSGSLVKSKVSNSASLVYQARPCLHDYGLGLQVAFMPTWLLCGELWIQTPVLMLAR